MRSICLYSSVYFGLSSQESDEAAYLLQTRTLQQKSGEAEDCYVTGGCKTPPATCGNYECNDGFVTRDIFKGDLGNRPCGDLCSNFKCCRKEILTCQDWQDENSDKCGAGSGWLFSPIKKLLPCGFKGCDMKKCCKEEATATTTESTTTTTESTTTTTESTTTTEATTTTTEATTTIPSVGEKKERPPPPRPGKKKTGDPQEDPKDYCVDQNYLDVSNCTVNNLGGMGPETWKAPELRYSGVTKVRGQAVDLVITVADRKNPYRFANNKYNFRNKLYGHTGASFISKYNGNKYRQDVMAIGSLAKGSFKFKFSFVNQRTGRPVVVPRVVFTLYDLDGEKVRVGRETKSYEELQTYDACMMEADDHSDVTYACEDKMVMGKKVQYCHAESAQVEIPIPANFDNPDKKAKQASLTLMYSKKSSFVMTYTLNFPHRVFLFKGQCVD